MANKKLFRVITCLAILLITILVFNNNVFASTQKSIFEEPPKGGWYDIFSTSGNDPLSGAKSELWGIVQAIGYATSIIMLVIIGIKYIWTSPDGKADVKKQLFPYVIGCALLFGATFFVGVIGNFAITKIQ